MKVKLGDLTKIRTGKLDANASSSNGEYPFFTCSKEPLHIDSYSYDCECVLVAGNGDLNVKYYNGKFDAYQRTYIIEDNGSGQLYMPYLYYFMDSYVEELRKLSIGGVIKYIKLENLTDALIELPKVENQKVIVNILDKAKRFLTYRQQQLQKLDDLVKARFVEMFGDCVLNTKRWNTRRLGDIAEVGSSKRVFVEELRESGIPFFRGTEIGALAEGKSIKPELFISENHYKELCSATGTPNMGDLLMPSICPDGRIWVVNTTEPFYFKDGRVLWVHKINRSYNSIFLLYTLKDRIMTDYSSIASGTTFAELKIFALKECRIFDAPLELQEQFAAFVTQADKSKVAVQKALDEAQLLFDSLMQKYFE